MKTIVVDDDIYGHLLKHTQEIGESASSILRRLLGLASQEGRAVGQVAEIFDFLKHPELYQHMNNAARFLFILSWAFRRAPDDFEKVMVIEGSKRKYFARDKAVLLEGGKSVNPRQIPDSPYWVITNSSTAKKCEVLADVFRVLGFDRDETSAMLVMVMKP